MYLSSRFSSSFEKRVRSRGQAYFADRRVEIAEGSKSIVRAVVRGYREYDVALTIHGRELLAACTCPYYDQDLCKHIWATMLAAQSKGYLTGTDQPPTRLVMTDHDFGDDEGYDEDDEDERLSPSSGLKGRFSTTSQRRIETPAPKPAVWRQQLESVNRSMRALPDEQIRPWPSTRELFYIVDVKATLLGYGLAISLGYREMKNNGEWGKVRTAGLPSIRVAQLPEPDRQIVAMLVGGREHYSYSYSYSSHYSNAPSSFKLFEPLDQTLLPMMCRTGRCLLLVQNATQAGDGPNKSEMFQLDWDDGEPWEFWLELRRDDSQLAAIGSLRRGGERMELAEPSLLTSAMVFARGRAAPLNDFDAFAWISQLRADGPLYAPAEKGSELLEKMLGLPKVPRLELPEELQYEEIAVAPQPRLKIAKLEGIHWQHNRVAGELSFNYNGTFVPEDDPRSAIVQAEARRIILRDAAAEQRAAERLRQLGFASQRTYYEPQPVLALAAKKMPVVVRTLVTESWHVEAEGNIYREPREFRIEVTSGIDWFELHGTVDFGDAKAKLPELIAALKRGDNSVMLGDGTFGLLPEEWLKKYGLLASLGSTEADHVRFTRSQIGLLDALLASQPEVSVDSTYSRALDELQRFEGVKETDSPPSFSGTLRGYQREGLGWLNFLQKFGFGGCLADDMGLGKTVQVLALLESRRIKRARQNKPVLKAAKKVRAVEPDGRLAPSLVVVPKSLVFNWIQEAARFTPKLRVLDHTGMTRLKTSDHFDDYDLIITTYGTLRRDAIQFKDVQFDYVILDEAQAIKNANTESSKAARLLRGNHRLAMSGTPIENHLGELWSLFQFLNPGLLGAASVFKLHTSAARNPDEHTRALLAKALRPFILRRTKQQVASDLPTKTEQTIYCEMEPLQRKLYDELRDHYRRSLLGLIERNGIKKSKIQILEALLRLRQAACHPGLIDQRRKYEPSAKLDVLLPQISEVLEEGHKALVFSQFTSLLAIVRDRLDREGIVYEYLDGKTRDRAARVERFQNDADCKLFLISLKAGGLGLNLTAAEYVFLLDPWWNPAVEAQAIDRAHRIGQLQQVFAYRLIARDTVEEKVLELQATKRALADAIISEDNSLIRSLGREDLELLLS
jgi:superfamily II DNA or RNA helicase